MQNYDPTVTRIVLIQKKSLFLEKIYQEREKCQKNRNQLMRIRTIDACLRRRNRTWTIDDLVEACEDALYEYEGIPEISGRTIRRDL